MTTRDTSLSPALVNRLHHADSLAWMTQVADDSVDFILTDLPYVQRYHDRGGRRIQNGDNETWIEPAFAQAYRILSSGRFLVCWYSWRKAERFFAAWRTAGFRPVGDFVAPKPYASAHVIVEHRHEQACLLAKRRADPIVPADRPRSAVALYPQYLACWEFAQEAATAAEA